MPPFAIETLLEMLAWLRELELLHGIKSHKKDLSMNYIPKPISRVDSLSYEKVKMCLQYNTRPGCVLPQYRAFTINYQQATVNKKRSLSNLAILHSGRLCRLACRNIAEIYRGTQICLREKWRARVVKEGSR